ncbi:hypothetical protein AAE478_006356 [Parahypoxylon ruwenzoriense]
MQKYYDSLQTTWPDLAPFRSAGGKVIHVHGEADSSIPAGSSVHYYESVRKMTYGGLSYNEGVSAVDEFYRLYLVPVIEWVENGVAPDTLNIAGDIVILWKWLSRPLRSGNGTAFNYVFDQASIDL